MKLKYTVVLLFIAIALCSCNKFLDIKPKGLILPEKVADYEGLLNSSTLTQTFQVSLLHFADDYLNDFDGLNQSPVANAYYWRPLITINQKADPEVWGPLYNAIYSTNVIINNVMEAKEGTLEKKEQVMGEALVIRASCYLDLLTVFAKAYNPATAATDPGLPLVTSTDVTDAAPGRSSVKVTLDRITNDVLTASALLPVSNINRYRVTKYVAYGVLSRLYLYMADYPNAKKFAEMALQAPHSSLNYNSFASNADLPQYELSPEVLWQRTSVDYSAPVFMLYSADLKTYFNDNDIRYSFLTTTNNSGLGRGSLSTSYNFGIYFPEMELTRAEVLARQDDVNGAMTIVNALRKNRIRTAAYADQTAGTGAEALTKVLAERRRELAFCGLRWFDMKRLDQEGKMPVINRINLETQAITATLAPRSAQYTFEIPIRVKMFNPGMELNHK